MINSKVKMSGSAAAVSKKNKKGQPTIFPDFMPDALKSSESVVNKEEKERGGGKQKKGLTDIGLSHSGSAAQKAKKETRVGNRIPTSLKS